MASCMKKRRVDEESDDLESDSDYSLGQNMKRMLVREITSTCLTPDHKAITLTPLKINNCNAADEVSDVPFSKAYCSTETQEEVYVFGDIFAKGLELIKNFLKNHQLPSVKHEKFILCKLLRLLSAVEEDINTFEDIDELSERELTTVLANHLFGRLAMSDDYIIDKTRHEKVKKEICHCGKKNCRLTGSYGDTSIGNGEVWHGNLDIIVNNDIGVSSVNEKRNRPVGKSPVEVKLQCTNLSKNSQIIAETIVFSFLQKKRHPENSHFLTPCIGVGCSGMIVLFYDAEHDILLESSHVPVMEYMGGGISKFNIGAILVSWLVVNYKYLCDGLTEDMLSGMKAEFCRQAKNKISIYKNDLKYQNVVRFTSSVVNLDKINVRGSKKSLALLGEFNKCLYNFVDN